MKFVTKLGSLTQRVSKKAIFVAAAVSAVAGLSFATVRAEFYPNRTPFDYNKPCVPNDADIYDRCGSLTGPVFNSFINAPNYGDERAFVDARRSDQAATGTYKNVLPDVTDGSKEVVIRLYVHNNANQSTNASGLGIAKNTKVRVSLPTGTSNTLRARGYVSADNAKPQLVEDTVDFTAADQFSVQYIPGSAKLYDTNNFAGGVSLSDSIVTSGAAVGSDSVNGDVKGCFEDKAVVEIRVKIIVKQAPKASFKKEVRMAGTKTWSEEAVTKPGDTVQWLLTTNNSGPVQLDATTVRDILPPHVQLVPGTIKRVDASRNEVLQNGPLFDGGYNLGSYGSGSGFYVMFDTKTLGDFEACEIRIRNRAFMKSDKTAEMSDTADVVIKKENCKPTTPIQPVVTKPQPQQPEVLPDTGAGDIVGIFVAVSALSTAAYQITIRRHRSI